MKVDLKKTRVAGATHWWQLT